MVGTHATTTMTTTQDGHEWDCPFVASRINSLQQYVGVNRIGWFCVYVIAISLSQRSLILMSRRGFFFASSMPCHAFDMVHCVDGNDWCRTTSTLWLKRIESEWNTIFWVTDNVRANYFSWLTVNERQRQCCERGERRISFSFVRNWQRLAIAANSVFVSVGKISDATYLWLCQFQSEHTAARQ